MYENIIREVRDRLEYDIFNDDLYRLINNSNNKKLMIYTILHRRALFNCVDKTKFKGMFRNHDLDKLAYYLYLPKTKASEIHRATQSHHYRDTSNYNALCEMVFDWESAHYTKPAKQLSAYETLKAFYPSMQDRIDPILKDLGYWEVGNYEQLTSYEYCNLLLTVSVDDIVDELKKSLSYLDDILQRE